MNVNHDKITGRILNLTLEVIYLLTGEGYILTKKTFDELETSGHSSRRWSRTQSPIMLPSPYLLTQEKNNEQKLLQLTNKIVHLLTGEVLEYLEGHKDVRENDLSLTSQDGSTMKNTSGRCPSPLYSRYCQKKDPDVPQDSQITRDKDLIDIKVEVLEEEEEAHDWSTEKCKEETLSAISVDKSTMKNTSERCPSPLYSKDCPKENQDVPQDSQDENLIDIKVEVLEEEEEVHDRSAEKCKEETLSAISAGDGKNSRTAVEEGAIVATICDIHQKDIAAHSVTVDENHVPCGVDVLCDDSVHSRSVPATTFIDAQGAFHACSNFFPSFDCFTKKSSFIPQETIDIGKNLFPCSACGRCFTKKSNLSRHQLIHTGEKPFPCPECGKSFKTKSDLVKHQKTHTGEKPFSCTECGKCFSDRSNLFNHKLLHTGKKPFPCYECGKCFTRKQHLLVHQRMHTGEKPFRCLECGRCFSNKCDLVFHEKIHTGERPFSCSKCGKSFIRKFRLVHHQKTYGHEEV